MNSGTFLLLLLILAVLAGGALQVWFIVISVRFLRSGRKAFDRYLETTLPPPVIPRPPTSWARTNR